MLKVLLSALFKWPLVHINKTVCDKFLSNDEIRILAAAAALFATDFGKNPDLRSDDVLAGEAGHLQAPDVPQQHVPAQLRPQVPGV